MASTVTLDDLEPRSTQTTTLDDHLYFPVITDQDPLPDSYTHTTDNQPRQILRDRLYVGNLHPSVDEYTLLQVFSKFGKVTKLDFLFHKTGPLKGKPRGYAFVEYGNKDDALKALTIAHERPLRGRKLIVTFAHQAPLDQYNGSIFSSSKSRKTMMDTGRPTTLSILKTGLSTRHEGKTGDKIAMMEAKLRQMESTNPKPAKPAFTLPDMDTDLEGITLPQTPPSASSSTLSQHPSLPLKPPPTIPEHLRPNQLTQSQSRPSLKEKSLLPPLPLPASIPSPRNHGQGRLREKTQDAAAPSAPVRSGKPTKFIGVKVKTKPKEKELEK